MKLNKAQSSENREVKSNTIQQNYDDFETIFNIAGSGLIIIEFGKENFGKIAELNFQAAKMLGINKNEGKEHSIWEYLAVDGIKELKKFKKNDISKQFNSSFSLNSGEIPINVSLSFLTFRGKESLLLVVRNRDFEENLIQKNKESEELYKSLIKYSSAAIYRVEYEPTVNLLQPKHKQVIDIIKSGRIAECNETMSQMYGFKKPEDLVGFSLEDLYGSIENKKNFDATLRFVESNFSMKNLITEERIANGELRIFNNNVFGVVKDGKLIRSWGIQTDITELEKIKRELESSKKELQSLLDKSPIPMVIVNHDLVAEYSNHSMELYFGYNKKDIPNLEEWWKKAYRHTKLSDKAKKYWITAAIKAKVRGKIPRQFETTISTKEGKIRHVQLYFASIGNKFLISLVDITDKKAIEEDLLKGRKQYETLFQNLPVGIFYFNENSEIVYFNEAFVKILGSSKTKLQNFNLKKSLLNSDVKRCVVETLQGKKQNYEGEYVSVTSGKISQIRLQTNPIYDSSGNITGIGILEDFSEKHAAKKLIEETLNRYKQVVEQQDFVFSKINDIIYRQDKNRNYLFISKGIKKATGYTQEEFLKQDGIKFTDNIINKTAIENTQKILQGIKIPSFPIEIISKNNKKILLEIRETATYENGKIEGIVGIARDITKEKEEERISNAIFEIINESEKSQNLDELYPKLHQILAKLMSATNMFLAIYNKTENIISFPYYVDEMDDPDEIITDVKPANGITEYVLRKQKNFIFSKKDIQNLVTKKEIDLLGTIPEQLLAVYLDLGSHRSGVLVLQDYRNPNVYRKEEFKIVRLVSNQIAFSIQKGLKEQEIIESNRQLRIAEVELKKQAEELKIINANKDKFFSIIAHDLRSPFTALLGLSRMLTESIDDFTVSELKEISTSIYNSSHNIFKLIENLLNWSRMQLGSLKVEKMKTSPFEIANSTIMALHETAKQKNIKISNKINRDHIIFVDPLMFETALRNVVNNSIKFTPTGGNIILSSKKIKGRIQISVEDDGIGMSEDIVAKLFDITQKVTREGTNREAGTGLGLILVKELIEKNGGEIVVKSAPNSGTTFKFMLDEAKI